MGRSETKTVSIANSSTCPLCAARVFPGMGHACSNVEEDEPALDPKYQQMLANLHLALFGRPMPRAKRKRSRRR